MRIPLLSRAILSLAITCTLAGCGTSYSSTRAADPILIARSESPAEVRAAIVRAMAARKFTAKSEEPGKIVARLDRGATSLDVAIEYSGTQYALRYVNSTGLKTKPGPAGELLVDDHWAGWVKGLRARIAEELAAPGKAAAETAQREREYQLTLEQNRTAQAQANAQAAQAAQPVPTPAEAPPQQPQPPSPGSFLPPIVVAPVIPLPLPQPPAGGINLQQSSFTCCVNGAHYTCANREAFKMCVRGGCTRDNGKCN